VSDSKKQPKKEEERDKLTEDQLDEAAGGIVFQDGLQALQPIAKPPTITPPSIPGQGGLPL
jgi:hypothetical protein